MLGGRWLCVGDHSLHGGGVGDGRGAGESPEGQRESEERPRLRMRVIGRLTASGRCVVLHTIKPFLKIISLLKSYTLLIAF